MREQSRGSPSLARIGDGDVTPVAGGVRGAVNTIRCLEVWTSRADRLVWRRLSDPGISGMQRSESRHN